MRRGGVDAVGKVANPSDQDWTNNVYVLHFGAYGDIRVIAYGNSLDFALEKCTGWLEDNAPGVFADEAVNDAFKEARRHTDDDDAAREIATVDTTSLDRGHYLNSWEWGIVAENPTREQLRDIFNR